jgi:hypothetical protein
VSGLETGRQEKIAPGTIMKTGCPVLKKPARYLTESEIPAPVRSPDNGADYANNNNHPSGNPEKSFTLGAFKKELTFTVK